MSDYHRHHSPPPTPPDHHDPHGPHSPRHFIKHLTEKVDFGEDVDFVVGVTATALTADQLIKQTTCKHHKVSHLAKAGLGAAVAATAFTMMSREHNQRKRKNKHHSRSRSRSRSHSPRPRPRGLLSESRHQDEEEWAVVRSRSPPPLSRSASVGAHRGYYYDKNPEYYSDDESHLGPPYPDDEIRRRARSRSRSISPEPERRRRAYSHGDTHRRGRSESPGTFKKMWKLVKDGMDTYERYDRARR